jgi:hypothetical protein
VLARILAFFPLKRTKQASSQSSRISQSYVLYMHLYLISMFFFSSNVLQSHKLRKAMASYICRCETMFGASAPNYKTKLFENFCLEIPQIGQFVPPSNHLDHAPPLYMSVFYMHCKEPESLKGWGRRMVCPL